MPLMEPGPRRQRQQRLPRAIGFGSARRKSALLESDLTMRLDWVLIGACAVLAIIGLVMIYSASRTLVEDDPFYFVKRQAIALGLGVALF
jgi:cell division protein FtsW (lipid II flippase)